MTNARAIAEGREIAVRWHDQASHGAIIAWLKDQDRARRFGNIDRAFKPLLDRIEGSAKQSKGFFYATARSALRTVLHLIAGADLRPESLGNIHKRLMTLLDDSPDLRAAVFADPDTPYFFRSSPLENASTRARVVLAADRRTPPDILARLAGDPEPDVQRVVAFNPNLPAAALAALIESGEAFLQLAAANNSATTAEQFVYMALRTNSAYTLRSITENFALPLEIQTQLANSTSQMVREGLAFSKHTPELVLEMLARDGADDVRKAVATNPNTTASILNLMVADSNDAVRGMVAVHPQVAPADVARLRNDPIAAVRHLPEARQIIELDPQAQIARLAEANSTLRWICASEKRLSSEALACLTRDPDASVRYFVASNPNTPPACLAELTGDIVEIRRNLAGNASSPTDAILALSADPDPAVQVALASHRLTSASVLRKLIYSTNNQIRCDAARNPNAPPDALAALLPLVEESAYDIAIKHPALMLEDLVADPAKRETDPVTAARWKRIGLSVGFVVALIYFFWINLDIWRPSRGTVSVIVPALTSVTIGYGLIKLVGIVRRIAGRVPPFSSLGEFPLIVLAPIVTLFLFLFTMLSGRLLLVILGGQYLAPFIAAVTAAAYMTECFIGILSLPFLPYVAAYGLYLIADKISFRPLKYALMTPVFLFAALGFFTVWYAGNHLAEMQAIGGRLAPLMPIQPSDASWVRGSAI